MKVQTLIRAGLAALLLVLVWMFAYSTQPVKAAALVVSNLNDSGAGSLRQAVIDAAATGDTITFSVNGTITFSSAISIDKNLTITGPGATLLTLNGGGGSGIFLVTGTGVAALSGMTLTGTGSGSAITNQGVLTVNDSIIRNNSSGQGGGIFSQKWLSVNNSVISNNTSGSDGGGIYIAGSACDAFMISNSTISGNTATNGGGGIYMSGGNCTMTMTGSLVSGNTASSSNSGNGIYLRYLFTAGSSSGNCFESTSISAADTIGPDTSYLNNNWWGTSAGPNMPGGSLFNNGGSNLSTTSNLAARPACGATLAGGNFTPPECPDDRLSCREGSEYAVLYARSDAQNKPTLHLYCLTVDGKGSLAGVITQADFEQFPKEPATNTLVKSFGSANGCRVPVSFWVLTTGEYQMVIGPNTKGDIIRLIFKGLPPKNMTMKKCNVLTSYHLCEQ